ncbi:Signal peptidase complex catalytic subunit [Tephrocybe rancida]|nr:Signal peptidase complex catalytic subunit [Tephrocybe rancida]
MFVLLQILNFASVISSGLMIWKGLGLITNSESPIVVVLSGSMEPAFYRGDLLFLTNPASELYHTGDITVYKIPGQDIPIVHRVLETHDMVQKKKEFLPFVGYVTIAMNDFPQLKYALLGGLGLLALIQRE